MSNNITSTLAYCRSHIKRWLAPKPEQKAKPAPSSGRGAGSTDHYVADVYKSCDYDLARTMNTLFRTPSGNPKPGVTFYNKMDAWDVSAP